MSVYAILMPICSCLGEGMKHVLLVEDDAHLRGRLTELLTREGLRLTAAEDDGESVREAFDQRF